MSWLSRNADLVAVSAIVLFAGAGSLAQSEFSQTFGRSFRVSPARIAIAPPQTSVYEIRDSVRAEVQNEVRNQIHRVHTIPLEHRDEIREAARILRDNLRTLREELRRGIPCAPSHIEKIVYYE